MRAALGSRRQCYSKASRRGIWALPIYAMRSPQVVAYERGTFQIVKGKIARAAVKTGRAYVNFSKDGGHDFIVMISPEGRRFSAFETSICAAVTILRASLWHQRARAIRVLFKATSVGLGCLLK
jgi:hypothetical protein